MQKFSRQLSSPSRFSFDLYQAEQIIKFSQENVINNIRLYSTKVQAKKVSQFFRLYLLWRHVLEIERFIYRAEIFKIFTPSQDT